MLNKNILNQTKTKIKDEFKEVNSNLMERITIAETSGEPLDMNNWSNFMLDKFDQIEKIFIQLEEELTEGTTFDKKRSLFSFRK